MKNMNIFALILVLQSVSATGTRTSTSFQGTSADNDAYSTTPYDGTDSAYGPQQKPPTYQGQQFGPVNRYVSSRPSSPRFPMHQQQQQQPGGNFFRQGSQQPSTGYLGQQQQPFGQESQQPSTGYLGQQQQPFGQESQQPPSGYLGQQQQPFGQESQQPFGANPGQQQQPYGSAFGQEPPQSFGANSGQQHPGNNHAFPMNSSPPGPSQTLEGIPNYAIPQSAAAPAARTQVTQPEVAGGLSSPVVPSDLQGLPLLQASAAYSPSKPDELEVTPGDSFVLLQVFGDKWMQVYSLKTGQTGMIPPGITTETGLYDGSTPATSNGGTVQSGPQKNTLKTWQKIAIGATAAVAGAAAVGGIAYGIFKGITNRQKKQSGSDLSSTAPAAGTTSSDIAPPAPQGAITAVPAPAASSNVLRDPLTGQVISGI